MKKNEFSSIKSFKQYSLSLFFIILFSTYSNAGGSIKYPIAVKNLTNNIYKIFIKNNMCKDRQECRNKELYFRTNSFSTIDISIFSVKDMLIAKEIMNACLDEYKEAHIRGLNKMGINLNILKISHYEYRQKGFFESSFNDFSFIKLEIKGDK